MELLVLSDLHGKDARLRTVLSRTRSSVDAVCFLGDGLRGILWEPLSPLTLYAVRGNCDWSADPDEIPEEQLLSLAGHRILLTHGHRMGVKSGTAPLAVYAASVGADIVLYGHTHTAREERYPAGSVLGGVTLARPLYLFNPGSLGEGSFGRLLLRGDTVLFSTGEV